MTRKNLATFVCLAALAACLPVVTAAGDVPSTSDISPEAALAELEAQWDIVDQLITIQTPYVDAIKALADHTGDDYVGLMFNKSNTQLKVFNLKLAEIDVQIAEIEVGESSTESFPSVSNTLGVSSNEFLNTGSTSTFSTSSAN